MVGAPGTPPLRFSDALGSNQRACGCLSYVGLLGFKEAKKRGRRGDRTQQLEECIV